jgi:hypothetical protein
VAAILVFPQKRPECVSFSVSSAEPIFVSFVSATIPPEAELTRPTSSGFYPHTEWVTLSPVHFGARFVLLSAWRSPKDRAVKREPWFPRKTSLRCFSTSILLQITTATRQSANRGDILRSTEIPQRCKRAAKERQRRLISRNDVPDTGGRTISSKAKPTTINGQPIRSER